MSVLFSGADKIRAPRDEDAYRAWLISRAQPPIVYHSGAMHLKRLRVLARKINSHVRAALTTIHHAIIAAKMRRIRRELTFHAGSHDEWSRSKWREGPGPRYQGLSANADDSGRQVGFVKRPHNKNGSVHFLTQRS
jgi:hypothetical protein